MVPFADPDLPGLAAHCSFWAVLEIERCSLTCCSIVHCRPNSLAMPRTPGGQIRFGRLRACGCAHDKFRAVLRCGTHIAQQEKAMAKGQKRSGREAKKPKQAKSTPPTAKPSGGTTSMQQLISSMTRGSSKNK